MRSSLLESLIMFQNTTRSCEIGSPFVKFKTPHKIRITIFIIFYGLKLVPSVYQSQMSNLAIESLVNNVVKYAANCSTQFVEVDLNKKSCSGRKTTTA